MRRSLVLGVTVAACAGSFAACVSSQNGAQAPGVDGGTFIAPDGAIAPGIDATTDGNAPGTPDAGATIDGATPADAGSDAPPPQSGTLDPGFGGSGFVTGAPITTADGGVATSEYAEAVGVDGQGRIVAAGYAWGTYVYDFVVATRLNANGTPDTTFGKDGVFSTGFTYDSNSDDYAFGLCFDGAGNLMLAGYSADFGGTPSGSGVVWRVTPAGVLDGTFGTGGYAFVANSDGFAIACTSAGTLYAGSDGAMVARITSGGALDTTGFAAPNGYVTDPLFTTSTAKGVAVDGTGKVVAVGYATASGPEFGATAWRYTSAGVADTTFEGTGRDILEQADAGLDASTVGGGARAAGVAIDSANDVVIAISSVTSSLVRLKPDGTVDATFGQNGLVNLPIPSVIDGGAEQAVVNGLVFDSQGRILVVGYVQPTVTLTDTYMVVWRFLANGTIDATFGSGGMFATTATAGGNTDYGLAIAVDGTDHPIVAGASVPKTGGELPVVWRLNP